MAERRRVDHNLGALFLRDAPDDKFFVGALIVMMDDGGAFHVHVRQIPGSPFGYRTAQLPEEAVTEALAQATIQAWGLANLPTTTD